MASGHVNRANRPNTWLHRPRLQTSRFSLPTRSRPHMAQSGHFETEFQCPLLGVKRTLRGLTGAVAAIRRAASVASASATG